MDSDLKQRWLADLKSGKYTHATGEFEPYEGENCCLGVLCHTMGVPVRPHLSDNWYACREVLGSLNLYGNHNIDVAAHLSILNDDSDDFTPVIEWIEKYL